MVAAWPLKPLDPMTDQPPPSAFDKDDMARRFLAAGVVVPADRAEGAYVAGARLLEAVHWLRKPRTAAAEPAHIFVARRPAS
jgi:hypothetical protein